MLFKRMPIEVESPEEIGYGTIRFNLAESSTADLTLGDLGLEIDLNALVLQYGDHRGHPKLRTLIAAEAGCAPEQVLLTTGAAGALFIVSTSMLTPRDHLVVIRPNYATNIETPRAIGCAIDFVELAFERGFALMAADIEAALRPQTKLVSITVPHNPTGTVLPPNELAAIAALVARHGCHLLVDETYRDLRLGWVPPYATTLGEHVISVSSFSKAYGLPGLRLGWLLTRDRALNEQFLAAKEQMCISGAIIEEEIGYQVYAQRATLRPRIAELVRTRVAIVREWIASQDIFEWVEPSGGVVCFPRIKPGIAVDLGVFYDALSSEFGTYVGPGHWFERDDRSIRIGFGWPTEDALHEGLRNVSRAAEFARIASGSTRA